MIERKFIKIRVDMGEDIKIKMIDMKPERDLINWLWTRFMALAGKVNLEGNLYMSKNLPYTIETLAIEFNRTEDQVKLALDVFIELEMIELTEDNVYRVRNFVKHQNIKVKEKIKPKEEDVRNKEIVAKEAVQNEINDNEDKESENIISQNEVEVVKIDEKDNMEITSSINKADNMSIDKTNNKLQVDIPIFLENKKVNKKINKKTRKKEIFDLTKEAKVEDEEIVSFHDYDENELLREGVVPVWSIR